MLNYKISLITLLSVLIAIIYVIYRRFRNYNFSNSEEMSLINSLPVIFRSDKLQKDRRAEHKLYNATRDPIKWKELKHQSYLRNKEAAYQRKKAKRQALRFLKQRSN